MMEASGGAALVDPALTNGGIVGLVRPDELEGDAPVQEKVLGGVDDAKSALAQTPVDAIASGHEGTDQGIARGIGRRHEAPPFAHRVGT